MLLILKFRFVELGKDFYSPAFFQKGFLPAGHLIISLFVFVNDLNFSKACLSVIFFYIGIILRSDQHIANYLEAGAITAGCILAGSTAAGVAVRSPPGLCHICALKGQTSDSIANFCKHAPLKYCHGACGVHCCALVHPSIFL